MPVDSANPDLTLTRSRSLALSDMFGKRATLFLALWLMLSSLQAAGTFVQFRTTVGDLELELYDQDKPVTVTNFLYYVKKGYTNDMFIHRWVPGFVIQGGLTYEANRQTSPSLSYITTLPAIVNEYGVGRTFSNTNGTIAMARSSQVNSATSQWYINLGNNSSLDSYNGGFTVFGRVIRGYDVLGKFAANTTQIWQARTTIKGIEFDEIPVVSSTPTLNDLVFVDITLLNVRVTDIGTGKQIVWRSVKDKINRVEYTTVFPPAWQTLATPVGTGNDMAVTDTSGDTKRFFRIRVDYP
jgi:peptidyl-prolyl cis-trans isomerase A (cyclophilin A)